MPDLVPAPGTFMLRWGSFVTLGMGGLPIGFALALSALIFIWVEGALPGVIFAQQMARGIDNFVLLAIPFFILVGYLMEANGMSVRLIGVVATPGGTGAWRAQRGDGRWLDGAVLGHLRLQRWRMSPRSAAVLIPAAKRSKQNAGVRGGAAGGLGRDGRDDPCPA